MSDLELTDDGRIDVIWTGGHMDPTHGIQALQAGLHVEVCDHCGTNPNTLAGAVIAEETRRAMGYIFSDGRPELLGFVGRRVLAWLRLVAPALAHQVPAEYWQMLDETVVPGGGWWRADEFDLPDPDPRECEWCGTAPEVVEWRMTRRVRRWFSNYLIGPHPEDLNAVMVRVYAVAKALFPELLEERTEEGHKSMSLQRLGEVFHEPRPEAGRARWSARVRKIFNQTVEARGYVAHAKFQKSETTCAKYAAAQVGNQNKRGKQSSAKPSKPCSSKSISPASSPTPPTVPSRPTSPRFKTSSSRSASTGSSPRC